MGEAATTPAYPVLINPTEHGVENVYLIHFGNTENRVTPRWIDVVQSYLDVIEKVQGPKACVIAAEGKFFSNGFDFKALATDATKLLNKFHQLLHRFLSYPIPLVAGINGHAFAGGAMMALACDYRIMNGNRGFLCLNEVEIGLPLTPGMTATIRAKADRSMWTEMMLGGKRYTAQELMVKNLVQGVTKPSDVLDAAMSFASKLAKKGANPFVYGTIKKQIYTEELNTLSSELPDVTLKFLSGKASKL